MADDDPLDPQSNHLVVVEDPPWFEQLARDWEKNGHTWYTKASERCYPGGPERTEEQRAEFARWVRDLGHQADLEEASVPPQVSITLPSPAYLDDPPRGRHSRGAIHVTRKAHDMITGPQRAVTGPLPRFQDAEVMDVVVADAPETPADAGSA